VAFAPSEGLMLGMIGYSLSVDISLAIPNISLRWVIGIKFGFCNASYSCCSRSASAWNWFVRHSFCYDCCFYSFARLRCNLWI